jgi:hypothetical protein
MSAGWGSSGWGDPLITTSDPFDELLTSMAEIYRMTGGTPDKYGVPNQGLTLIADDIPCRLSTLTEGQEFKVGKELAIAKYKIFMRQQDFAVTEKQTVKIEARTFNPLSVLLVRARDNAEIHHLEIFAQEILP